jgi:hypothetical protein
MTTQDISVSNLPLESRRDRSEIERTVLARRARRTRWLGRVSLALPLVGAAAGAWLLSRRSQRRVAAFGALGSSIGLGFLRWQLQRFVTEKVAYELEATLGEIEFRNYPSQVWAETVVEQSTWKEALNEGFHRLAGYIFGDNDGGERLSMTTPVFGSLSGPASEASASPGGKSVAGVADRALAFVMPADRVLGDLPKPRDSRVQLRAIPERLVAVLTFSGDYESGLPEQKRDTLLEQLRAAGIKTRGEATFAGYDPPSTIAALRRNEVMIELADL